MKTVGLVACCGPKLEYPAPAGQLYVSDLFRKSVAYLRSLGINEWAILSAKYGLVFPSTVIPPYDLELSKMPVARRREWARRTQEQIEDTWPEGTHFVVLAGRHYVKAIPPGYSYEDPLKGMGFERKRWLVEATRAAKEG